MSTIRPFLSEMRGPIRDQASFFRLLTWCWAHTRHGHVQRSTLLCFSTSLRRISQALHVQYFKSILEFFSKTPRGRRFIHVSLEVFPATFPRNRVLYESKFVQPVSQRNHSSHAAFVESSWRVGWYWTLVWTRHQERWKRERREAKGHVP